jgi:hypothetical protein
VGVREPIYETALPPLTRGRDLVVLARVHEQQLPAFLAPAILDLPRPGKGPCVLLLSADRELSAALLRCLRAFAGQRPVTAVALSEERAVRREAKDLEQRPDAVVATPARLIDHIRRSNVGLSGVRFVAIFEGREGPPEGFRRDVQFIASKLPGRRQTVVAAAGLTRESAAATYALRRPVFLEPADLLPRQAPAPVAAPKAPQARGASAQEKPAVSKTAPTPAATDAGRGARIPEEKVLAQALETILKTIRQQEDPEELNRYRKVFKQHVPIFMRSYVAAYLFKKGLDGNLSAPSNTTKLFVGIGKNRQVFAKDIIKLFMDRLAIQRSQIGDVKVLESYSFVDISLDHAQEAISKLSGVNFRGRRLTVNLARKRGEGGDPGRRQPQQQQQHEQAGQKQAAG